MASEKRINPRDPHDDSLLVRIIALVSAATGLVAEAASYFKTVREAFKSLNVALPDGSLSVLGAILLALAALLARMTRKRSRLSAGETLKLNRDDPKMFVGREDDVELLLDKCVRQPLVFLKGDSGCGKSALIRSGLEPVARRRERLYPLILDYEGRDWEAAPMQALRNKIAVALTREAHQIKANELDDLETALQLLGEVTGRTPLIVFDQIDDYQQNHRDTFVTAQRSTLNSRQLVADNRFWGIIATALKKGEAHVLLATRSDMAGWLDSFRFVEPQDHLLFNVETVALRQLLQSLASRVRNPGSGWEQLVDRIIADLDVDGRILPQRMRIMMRGLERLPALTPREYSKAGEALGVDALYVEGAIRDAVTASGLSHRAMRALLYDLVDPANPRKTRRRSINELQTTALAFSPDAAVESVENAVRQLEDSEVIRNVTDASNPDVVAVQLDHDYLAVVIRAVVRRADRWNTLLQKRCAAFERAGLNVLKRWQQLLGVREFWPLIWAKAARHDDAGDLTGRQLFIALSSLTTVVPLMAIAAVVFVGLRLYLADDYARRVGNLSVAIQAESDTPTADFIDMSHVLRSSPAGLREEMLRHILQNKLLAERASLLMPYIVRSLAGTSNEERLRLIEVAQESPPDPSQPAITLARETALLSLDARSHTALPIFMEAFSNDAKRVSLNGPPPLAVEAFQRIASRFPRDSLLGLLRTVCNMQDDSAHQSSMRELGMALVAAGKFDRKFLQDHHIQCYGARVDVSVADTTLERLAEANNEPAVVRTLSRYKPEPWTAERRLWFDQVKTFLGESRFQHLIQGPINRALLAGNPIAEFSFTRGGSDREGMRYILYEASSANYASETEGYHLALAYLLLNDVDRNRVRSAFHRDLLRFNSSTCPYARSLWPRYGSAELLKFIDMLVTGSERWQPQSIWSCVDQVDLQTVAQDVPPLAKRPTSEGREPLETILDALPPSTVKSEVVREEIDYRLAQIRASFAAEKHEHESTEMQRPVDAVSAQSLDPRSEVSAADQRRKWLMALLYVHPALIQGLSVEEKGALWSYLLQDIQLKDTPLSLVDAHRLAQALGRQLDEPSQRHLADQFYDHLSGGSLAVDDSDKSFNSSLSLLKSDSHYTTADVQHAVRSLTSEVRSSLATKVVRDICRAERPDLVPLMISVLAAAAGDHWDTAPWLAIRLQLLNLAITVGHPTEQLLGQQRTASTDHSEQGSFWKSLDQFRREHGLQQATLDHLRTGCPSPDGG